ncbi:tyrosine-type recombinase/integrase [Oribacterium sp. FC2011]|uniref:tyrosine-type recombinase/integrase n=1 Tax=Oribacterium sp. FC2011 TaxID=1408311 RepID=UPI0004E1B6DD|nr:tyrosine-type recombinase/integrase [Oribacterium sp. FC2011]
MAVPRNHQFYDEPLVDLPEDRQWLIKYHENSCKLVDYLIDHGAKSTSYNGAQRCLKLLREYLIGINESYTPERAMQWYTMTGPYPGGYLPDLHRLADLYSHGEIQPINAFPQFVPYSKKLEEPWIGILNDFLETTIPTEKSLERVRNCISRFLYKIQQNGISSPSDISFEMLEEYCRTDAHISANHKAIYIYMTGDLLLFMADRGMCIHGLGWYPYYWMHNRIFRLCDMSAEHNLAVEELRQKSIDFPAEEFAALIPDFLKRFESLGYSESPTKAARYTLTNLLLFIEMHDLGYHPKIADIWLEHEKTFHKTDSWKQSRRILFLFNQYIQNGDVIPQTINRIRPLLSDSLPGWCQEMIKEYMSLKKKEGWEDSTLCMIHASVTRFCIFLTEAGYDSFLKISGKVLKEFNLWDQHLTVEGKNAYNVRIRQFIKFLERKEIVPYGVHQALCCGAAPKENVVVTLTQEEKEAIKEKHSKCHSFTELRDKAMILLGTKMGLRASDIVTISLEDIDWNRQTLRIIQEKTNHEILIPMPTEVGNAICLYITEGRANKRTSSKYLFIKKRVPYDGFTRHACASALRRTLPDRAVPGSGFHVTRKTFATDRLRNGTGKQGITDLLGQKDSQSLNHYLQMDETMMRMCPLSLEETGLLMKGERYGKV